MAYKEKNEFLNSYSNLELKNTELKQKNEELIIMNEELSKKNYAEILDSKLVINGMENADLKNCIAIINNKIFYDDSIIHNITGQKIRFDNTQNIVFYGNEEVNQITKVEFSDISDILYNGQVYWKYSTSDDTSFLVGGKEYSNGFAIGCDHSLFGEGDGYVLFNLEGKYNQIEFDVGKTDEYEMQDVTMKLYLNGQMVEQYELSAQTPSKHISFGLNNAEDLKILLTGGTLVKYGFYNIILSK